MYVERWEVLSGGHQCILPVSHLFPHNPAPAKTVAIIVLSSSSAEYVASCLSVTDRKSSLHLSSTFQLMASVTPHDSLDQLRELFKSDTLSEDKSNSVSFQGYHLEFDHRFVLPPFSCSATTFTGSQLPCNSRIPLPVSLTLPVLGADHVVIRDKRTRPDSDHSEVQVMKERFTKLLLGEDMSGGGKGVSTALAISNDIINLSDTVFGELWKLEPLTPQKKSMWRREIDWLLCVSNSIVELVPSIQEFPGGKRLEIMVSRQRSDLYVNLPALKKLESMLLSILDGFHGSQFYYVDYAVVVSAEDDIEALPLSTSWRRSTIPEDSRWLPFPKVPRNGLSVDARKKLHHARDCSHQILKAAKAINNSVLAEMEIPDVYLDSLPKSGRCTLSEVIYHYVSVDKFSPESFLHYLDLGSKYSAMEIANAIEASIHIWRQKYQKMCLVRTKLRKSSWGTKVKDCRHDLEKLNLLAHRAEILLQNLRPTVLGLLRTTLDISKIQHNKDIGHSILEGYSRVIGSLSFNIMTRIDDVLYIDDATQRRAKESILQRGQEKVRNGFDKQY